MQTNQAHFTTTVYAKCLGKKEGWGIATRE